MSFWDRVAGGVTAPAEGAPQAPPAAPTTRPWWDSPALMPHQQSSPPPEAPETVTVPQKAMSARSKETCPECGSGNYFKPVGHANAMSQCYTCGYNPRFAHSTAGAGMPSDRSVPTRPAKQVSTENNYNPGTIVGHVAE